MNYNSLKATADKLLEKMGMAITLSRYETSGAWVKSYNPLESRNEWKNTGTGEIVLTAPAGNPVAHSGYGIRTDYKTSEIDGTNIQKGDVKLVISTDFPVPTTGDRLTADSVVYNYVSHEEKSPAGIGLVYIVQVRP